MQSIARVCLVCGQRLTVAPTGRPRRYCSGRCRERARRARSAEAFSEACLTGERSAAPQPSAAELTATINQMVGLPPGPPEEVLQSLVMGARALTAAFGLAARATPPQLAWRCEEMAEQIATALQRFFEVP